MRRRQNGPNIPPSAPPPAPPAPAPSTIEDLDSVTSRTGKELLGEIAAFEGSAGELMDYWRLNRARRNSLAPAELKVVVRAYQARFNQLNEE